MTDKNGTEITGSKETFVIEFVHLKVPQTSLGSDKTEYTSGTKYTIINDYPADNNILLYYTTDGTEPQTSDTRKQYAGEELSITGAVTVISKVFVCPP